MFSQILSPHINEKEMALNIIICLNMVLDLLIKLLFHEQHFLNTVVLPRRNHVEIDPGSHQLSRVICGTPLNGSVAWFLQFIQ